MNQSSLLSYFDTDFVYITHIFWEVGWITETNFCYFFSQISETLKKKYFWGKACFFISQNPVMCIFMLYSWYGTVGGLKVFIIEKVVIIITLD